MLFEWDDAKRAGNLAKHGVDFKAVSQFDWTTSVQRLDERSDYGEPRWQALGMIVNRLYMLVFTQRDDRIRVISLRKANNQEVVFYEEANSPDG
jgi:uncharacterized DUF497 family protein